MRIHSRPSDEDAQKWKFWIESRPPNSSNVHEKGDGNDHCDGDCDSGEEKMMRWVNDGGGGENLRLVVQK